jgi:spoIIIJ-associated protein
VEWVEASGRSLEEARSVAVDLLGVGIDDAEFVVLSEPKAGLFGRLRGEARVQARVRPVAPPPKRTRRDRPERKSRGAGRTQGPSAEPSSAGSAARRTAPANSGQKKDGNNDQPEQTRRPPATRQRQDRPTAENVERETPTRDVTTEREREDTMEERLTLERQGELAAEFVRGLVRSFGLTAEVAFRVVDDETVEVAADGPELGILIGQKGSTLAAIQELARSVVQRHSEQRTDRILVDVGGYRQKRTAALARFTTTIAEEVRSSGEERALEPMTPADRKIVHDVVNEIEGVVTRSEGVEPSRYVVISPKG